MNSQGSSTSLASGGTSNFMKKLLFQLVVVVIAIQLTLVASWGWTWVLFLHPGLADSFLKIAVVLGSALIAGIIARTLLKEHLRVTRWICANASIIFSLVGLSYLSDHQVGFQVSLIDKSVTHWDGLLQLLIGAIVSWLVLYAWRKPVKRAAAVADNHSGDDEIKQNTSLPQQTPAAVRSPSGQQAHKGIRAWGIRTFMEDIAAQFHAIPSLIVAWEQKLFPRENDVRLLRPTKKKAKFRQTHGILPASRAAIKLVGAEEHRCPYCLELVDETQKDEVVVCPICNTVHHKSCWEITGTCQVPHIHS